MDSLTLVFQPRHSEWHPRSYPAVVDSEGLPAFRQQVDHPGKLDINRNLRLLAAAKAPEMMELIRQIALIAGHERHDIHAAPAVLERIQGTLKAFLDDYSRKIREVIER